MMTSFLLEIRLGRGRYSRASAGRRRGNVWVAFGRMRAPKHENRVAKSLRISCGDLEIRLGRGRYSRASAGRRRGNVWVAFGRMRAPKHENRVAKSLRISCGEL